MRFWAILWLILILSACGGGSDVPYQTLMANRGYDELTKGNYDQAEAYLEIARSINPEDPYVLLNLGVVYQNTGRIESAKSMYQKVLELNPDQVAIDTTNPSFKGKKLAEIARRNLKSLEK